MILELKDQLTTLEQSRRLNELGLNCAGLYCWVKRPLRGVKEFEISRYQGIVHDLWEEKYPCYKAYTSAELDILLPGNGWTTHQRVHNIGNKTIVLFSIIHDDEITEDFENEHTFKNSTGAQARSSALIWLIENGYIDVKELNERFKQ